MTVNVAVLWVICAWFAARHVGTMNAARAVGALMTAHMGSAPPVGAGGRPSLFSAIMGTQPLTPEQREAQQQVARQTAAVEVIVLIWERGVWVIAGLLDLLALLAVLTRRVRGFHLTAAVIILLATGATLVAMRLLMHPDYGGMPPLSILSYTLVGAVQGLYGLILLAAFWRKPEVVRLPGPIHSQAGN